MKTYSVYFKWLDDNTEDSFHCNGQKELLLNLREIHKDPMQEVLYVDEVKKDGEYVLTKYR